MVRLNEVSESLECKAILMTNININHPAIYDLRNRVHARYVTVCKITSPNMKLL